MQQIYLRKARRAAQISQVEMAAKIGKSYSTYQKYEQGLIEVPGDVRKQLSRILGVAEDDLFRSSLRELSDEDQRILDLYNNAEVPAKQIVVEILERHQIRG